MLCSLIGSSSLTPSEERRCSVSRTRSWLLGWEMGRLPRLWVYLLGDWGPVAAEFCISKLDRLVFSVTVRENLSCLD